MGTPLGPKHILYSYMEPLGVLNLDAAHSGDYRPCPIEIGRIRLSFADEGPCAKGPGLRVNPRILDSRLQVQMYRWDESLRSKVSPATSSSSWSRAQ